MLSSLLRLCLGFSSALSSVHAAKSVCAGAWVAVAGHLINKWESFAMTRKLHMCGWISCMIIWEYTLSEHTESAKFMVDFCHGDFVRSSFCRTIWLVLIAIAWVIRRAAQPIAGIVSGNSTRHQPMGMWKTALFMRMWWWEAERVLGIWARFGWVRSCWALAMGSTNTSARL